MFCTRRPGNSMLTGRKAVPSMSWKACTCPGLSLAGSSPPACRTSGGSFTSSRGALGGAFAAATTETRLGCWAAAALVCLLLALSLLLLNVEVDN